MTIPIRYCSRVRLNRKIRFARMHCSSPICKSIFRRALSSASILQILSGRTKVPALLEQCETKRSQKKGKACVHRSWRFVLVLKVRRYRPAACFYFRSSRKYLQAFSGILRLGRGLGIDSANIQDIAGVLRFQQLFT